MLIINDINVTILLEVFAYTQLLQGAYSDNGDDIMNSIEEVRNIFIKNKGIIKTTDITSQGIHNRVLDTLLEQGQIIKIKRGIYQWVEDSETEELEILVKLLPESILCMYSALYHYGYTDRTPDCFHIAVDRNCNKSKLNFDYPYIKPHFMIKEYLEIGVEETVINNVKVKIFNRDRTICDIIKHSSRLDREVVNKAIQEYIHDNSKNIGQLIEYSKQMRVYNKVNMWIGMWL